VATITGRIGSRAPATVKHRVAVWRMFAEWLRPPRVATGLVAAPPTDGRVVAGWVRGFLASRLQTWAVPTALNALGAISIALGRLEWPVHKDTLADTRAQLARLLPFHQTRQAPPATPSQVARLRLHLPPPDADAVTLLWAMAARFSDLERAALRDVQLTSRGWVVRLRLTKTTQAGVRGAFGIHLPEPQHSGLRQRKAAAPPDQPLLATTAAALRRNVRQLCPGLTLHSFRRGAVQALLDAAVPTEEVRRLTGHTTEATLLGYADRLPPSAWAAAATAARVLF
jgi:integrase